MNRLSKYSRNKLLIGLVSLLSMLFLASPPFESNPQECEMIRVIGKKNKDGNLTDEDPLSTEYNIN